MTDWQLRKLFEALHSDLWKGRLDHRFVNRTYNGIAVSVDLVGARTAAASQTESAGFPDDKLTDCLPQVWWESRDFIQSFGTSIRRMRSPQSLQNWTI